MFLTLTIISRLTVSYGVHMTIFIAIFFCALRRATAAEFRLLQWLNQFGMTPSSRAGVSARKPEEADPWDGNKYLKSTG